MSAARGGSAIALVAVALAAGGLARLLPRAEAQRSAAAVAAEATTPLQPMIDAAEPGATLTPRPGRYSGPVVITKPLTLDGGGAVVIDGLGKGTVVHIKGDGITVKGLTVTNSGDQHNDIDAGIRIEGRNNVVKDNSVEESLFGIDLQEADDNVVRRNRISSKGDAALGVKGDAIRLWYAHGNRIEENTIAKSRDLVVWYSLRNTIARNEVSDSRYGLHCMFAKDNVIEDNRLDRNLVGIYLMYDERDVIRGNRIFQAQGAAGVGIGFKEASSITVEDNEILYNAVGLSFDLSPFEPGSTIRMARNRIAFNDIGVSFLSDRPGNIFLDNKFIANTQHVAMRLFESAVKAEWDGNYWDDYEGFDRDGNGVGDRPHVLRTYADRLWMDVPAAALFKGSPALSALDFIERLAPFTEPLLLLKDDRPRMARDFKPRSPAEADARLRPAVSKDESEDDTPAARPAGEERRGPDGRLDPFGLHSK